jgi:lysophospholipase L1-like esterase
MPRSAHLARIALAVMLGAATLELCARIDDWHTHDAPLTGYFDIDTIYEFDELGRRGKPNARFQKWKLNSLGFRGPDLEPGKLTVAVLGASETFGLYESEDNEFPRQLERLLQQRLGEAVQVANVSYAGMSVGQALIRLDETLEAVDPKLLIVYPSVAAYVDPPRQWRLGRDVERGPLARLRIAARVRELLKRLIPAALQTAVRDWQARRAVAPEDTIARIPQAHVERFAQELNTLIDRSMARGVDVVLATHATRFGDSVRPEERGHLIDWRKFYPQLAEAGFLDMENRLNEVIRSTARQRGLILVDAAAKIEPGGQNFVEFVHFTDRGAGRMAEILADGVTRRVSELLGRDHSDAPKQVP